MCRLRRNSANNNNSNMIMIMFILSNVLLSLLLQELLSSSLCGEGATLGNKKNEEDYWLRFVQIKWNELLVASIIVITIVPSFNWSIISRVITIFFLLSLSFLNKRKEESTRESIIATRANTPRQSLLTTMMTIVLEKVHYRLVML